MKDIQRIDPIIETLRRIWKQCPDFRLGQLLCNAAMMSEKSQDPFHIEDDALNNGLLKIEAVLKENTDGR